jgi:hypothetical protein
MRDPEIQAALRDELKAVKALASSRTITTEEGRALSMRLVRLIEILVEGKASTTSTLHHA